MGLKQQTIREEIIFSGKGLHTGLQVTMRVKPAPANHGITFRRVDLEGTPSVPALGTYVTDTSRGTTIECGAAKVSTIEHIMSALWTLGVDNAEIDINAPETPIMDGSAKEYAAEIERVGVEEQEAEREYYTVTEEVSFAIPEKGVEVRLLPAEEYDVDVAVDYNSKVLGAQQAHFAEGDNYRAEIAPCRTFVFLHEIMFLFNANLIKGGDVDNAIVVVEHPVSDEEIARLSALFNKSDIKVSGGYLNNLKLRFENEIARHKLLDILGDLALLGRRIRGKVVATRPGHYANTELVKKILA